MIVAVAWDLGGVLCGFHPERRVREMARRSGAAEHDVRALLTRELRGRLDAGVMTGDELLAAARAKLGWPRSLHELGAAWATAFEPTGAVLALAQRVVVPAAVLTNNGPPLSDRYGELLRPVAAVVPATLFSGQTRLVKPDRSAFLNACAFFDADPSDVLLVDDSPTNTAAAERAGLRTYHYRNAESLEEYLDHEHLLASR